MCDSGAHGVHDADMTGVHAGPADVDGSELNSMHMSSPRGREAAPAREDRAYAVLNRDGTFRVELPTRPRPVQLLTLDFVARSTLLSHLASIVDVGEATLLPLAPALVEYWIDAVTAADKKLPHLSAVELAWSLTVPSCNMYTVYCRIKCRCRCRQRTLQYPAVPAAEPWHCCSNINVALPESVRKCAKA